MPYLIGPAPIRRTLQYLKSGKVLFKDRVKIMEVHYNIYWRNYTKPKYSDPHVGMREFYFWGPATDSVHEPKSPDPKVYGDDSSTIHPLLARRWPRCSLWLRFQRPRFDYESTEQSLGKIRKVAANGANTIFCNCREEPGICSHLWIQQTTVLYVWSSRPGSMSRSHKSSHENEGQIHPIPEREAGRVGD